ncbi:hypothetical protein [Planctomyces sp. SH-PL14]|uniref:hypothetical protein n=1 Tax=Planctomyces sp. SH-PL14 TaxID=1632864 RepID=UPI00078E7212|nr:hypothetical protein [Planctomyces sp. SH-PL14]AMV22240.1 hypothetical protein VT03_30325 [Planctomyces sp. SH-PL14]
MPAPPKTTSSTTPAPTPPPTAPSVPPIVLRSLVVLALALVSARLLTAMPLSSANDRSRWCTVYSLAHQGTYQIDDIRQRPGWDTIDIVKKDGHFYSTKPPILSWITAQLYLGLYRLTGWTFDTRLEWVTRTLLFLINVLPAALSWVIVVRWALRFAQTPLAAVVTVLTCTLGSLLTPFLTTFNNHTPAAAAVVFTLAAAIPILLDGRRDGWRFFLAGLFAAWTVCNELPAAAFAGLLFLWLMRLSPRKTLTWGIVGALLPLALYFWTTYQATGSWKPFYASYGKELYVFTHEGVPSYWTNPKGLDTNRDSWKTYLLHCTIGHHGWFSLTPIFLFSLLAWFPGGLRNHPLRGLMRLGGAVSVIVFAFYMLQPEHYNFGGKSQALRWMLWVTPFWGLALLPALDLFCQARWSRGPVLLAFGLSAFSAWYPADGPWTSPWIYSLMERWKWIDYSDLRPPLPRPISSWIYTLPETAGPDPDYWTELESLSADGVRQVLRLEDAGPFETMGRRLRGIKVIRARGADEPVSQILYVDPKALMSGLAAESVLAGDVTEEDRVFFQGLPQGKSYAVSSVRYVKTPLEQDALPTLLIYSSCAVPDAAAPGGSRSYIRDVWTNETLPFGIVQTDARIAEFGSTVPVARERWSLKGVGKRLPAKSAAADTPKPGPATP